MHRHCISVVLLILLMSFSISAQIVIEEPEEISQLHEKIKTKNSEKDTDSGWRIQIIATTERRNMDREMVGFEQRFPELKRTAKYKKPYYRIMVGAEKERMELYPLLQKVQEFYPSAFIIKDPEIPKEEFFSS